MKPGRLDIGRYVSNELLRLIVMPTEQCNFRCVYCYEDFENGRMADDVVDGLKALLSARIGGLHLLQIEWFGGEPLLAQPVIENVMLHTRETAAESNPRLILHSMMTTNGYFLDSTVLARLVELGILSYQISLDGTSSSHDERRLRADGRGTFNRIFDNVLAARDSSLGFSIKLRLHVDRQNPPQVRDLLRLLASEIGGDDRFEIYLRPVGRFGGGNDSILPILDREELDTIGELKQLAESLGLRLTAENSEPCYAATANSFVIRSTGEIAKCTVALSHPNNRVGVLGRDGKVTVDGDKLAGWVRGLFSGSQEQLACPMKGFASPDVAPASSRLPIVHSSH